MKRALVVYCHPNPESFCAHLRDRVVEALSERGVEHQIADLYGEGFEPVMHRAERLAYRTEGVNEAPVAAELARLKWCDALIFVYPTWWFGLPAMLKGWLDRVLVPHATFTLPTAERPFAARLQDIATVAAVTTCGARRLHSKLIGEPGRKTLLRGVRHICHPNCRTRYLAMYEIDSSTPERRTAYAAKVHDAIGRL